MWITLLIKIHPYKVTVWFNTYYTQNKWLGTIRAGKIRRKTGLSMNTNNTRRKTSTSHTRAISITPREPLFPTVWPPRHTKLCSWPQHLQDKIKHKHLFFKASLGRHNSKEVTEGEPKLWLMRELRSWLASCRFVSLWPLPPTSLCLAPRYTGYHWSTFCY